jgi:hypothetical protein
MVPKRPGEALAIATGLPPNTRAISRGGRENQSIGKPFQVATPQQHAVAELVHPKADAFLSYKVVRRERSRK